MLEINIHHLRAFHAVVRHLSFSRAAEELYVSQPALSRQVQELEKVVGAQVFHRQGKRIAITDAGRRVFDYAQRLLDLTDELEQAVGELEDPTRGHLRLAACSTLGVYVLPSFLARFRQRLPEIEISLQVSNSQQAAAAMAQDGYHLGFVSMEIEAPGLIWQTLAADELVVASHPDHPFARGEISAEDLCGETILLREPGSGTRLCLERELERLGARPRRVLEIGSTEAIKRGIAAGLGVSAITRMAVSEGEAGGGIGLVHVDGLELRRTLGILTRKGARLPPAALAFIAALQKMGL